MRKFFSILLYIIAGLFLASVVQNSFFISGGDDILEEAIFFIFVVLNIFLLLASLLYPSNNFYNPLYITFLTVITLMSILGVNTYFVTKGINNLDINSSATKTFSETDIHYNMPFGISMTVVLLLLTLYFYFQSHKMDMQATNHNDEKTIKKKRWLPFFISLSIVNVVIYGLSQLFIVYDIGSSKNIYSDLNRTSYIKLIQQHIDANDSIENIAQLASMGYDNYSDNKDEFISYDTAIKEHFSKKTWKDKSSILTTKLWANVAQENNLTQESFDTFFEQLEALDADAENNSTISGLISAELPSKYINYMEKQLEKIASSTVEVPLVMLYKKDGSTIEEMKSSRDYLVSEVYRRITDFCDEAENIYFDVEYYAKKSAESSPLNPSALFMYAYYSEDSSLIVDLLEDVLALTKVSNELLENEMFAVYNNLGFNIYRSDQKNKYDDALKYLKKAYALNSKAVYSLTTMAGIYREKKQYKSAYDVMKYETYRFFHASDDELVEKEISYWTLVKGIIATSYELKDYNTTKYACKKYIEIHDNEYEDCQDYLEEIKNMSDGESVKPIYSFWKLYTEPEMFQHKSTQEIKGTLGCGTVMKYGDSLKYKSTSQIQSGLLKKFSTIYAPYQVPETLKALIKIEEKLGADSYTISFYLDPEPREVFFEGTFSYDDKALNNKVAKHFFPLAHIDGTGASAALWAIDGNKTDLENAPIVEFGSEGQIDIVAKNLKDFIYMLSFGVEPMDGGYSQFIWDNEEYYRRENFEAYRKWLKETMHIEPVQDLKIWGTPKKLETMQIEAQKLYTDRLYQWLYKFIPEHGVVKEGKEKADTFLALKEKKEALNTLLEKSATSKLYCQLARNEKELENIDRSSEENVSSYYKKAFTVEHNESIIDEWAMVLGRFTDKRPVKNDKDKAYLYLQYQEVYTIINDKKKSNEYLNLALDLYKKVAKEENSAKDKMRLYDKIAEIYKDENQTEYAIEFYKKAIDIKVDDDDMWMKKYYYRDLAELYEEQKKYTLAIENYKDALAILKEKKDKAVYNYKIAFNYKLLKSYKDALFYARKAYVQVPENSILKGDTVELISSIKEILHPKNNIKKSPNAT